MALPKLNTNFEFEMTLPVAGTTHKFRPYLVKEEKALLLASESQDPKEINAVLKNIVTTCVDGVDVSNLTIADVTYAFLQLRGKSVGEVADFSVPCEKCQESNSVSARIDDITVDTSSLKDAKIPIKGTSIVIQMKSPTYDDVIRGNTEAMNINSPKFIYDVIDLAIDKIFTDNDLLVWSEQSRADRDEFVGDLDRETFALLKEFVESIPSPALHLVFECGSCGHSNDRIVEGIQNFFA